MTMNRLMNPTRRSSLPTKRLLPLVEPQQVLLRRPIILVGLGETGESVLAQLGTGAWICLTRSSDGSQWNQAIQQVQRPLDADSRTQGADWVHVLVVGKREDIATGIGELDTHWMPAQRLARVRLAVLEVGAADESSHAPDDAPQPCSLVAWFRLAGRYANGVLDETQQIRLAGELLRREFALVLFDFAERRHPQGPVLLGAAFAWQPEATLGDALGAYYAKRVADRLANVDADSRRPPHSLLTMTMFSGLQNRLEQHFAREADRFRRQFPSRYRRQPLPRLDGDIFPDAEAAERVVEAWLDEYAPVYQRTLASQLRDIPSIARCQASIQQAIQQLEMLRQQSLKQRDVLAVDRLELMQQMADSDGQRLATAGLFAGLRRWFRTWRVSRTLRLCLDLRRQELVQHYQALAMTKIRERLSGVLRRVETLRRNSAAVQDRLANLLTPTHPQYLALDPSAAMELLLAQFAEFQQQKTGEKSEDRVWRGMIPQIPRHGPSTDDLWAALDLQSRRVAGELNASDQPLAEPSRLMMPAYQTQTLRSRLVRLAEPLFSLEGDPHAGPWAEDYACIHFPLDDAHPAQVSRVDLPVVLCFRW